MTAIKNKPSIVFAHGLWADGSCFSKLIPTLQAEGHEVMAAQYGLDSLAGDVAAVKNTLRRVSGPILLVGHSYGGTVITAAGTDPRVAELVRRGQPGSDCPSGAATLRGETHGGEAIAQFQMGQSGSRRTLRIVRHVAPPQAHAPGSNAGWVAP